MKPMIYSGMLFLFYLFQASAQDYATGNYFVDTNNVLLNGYDLLSYFTAEEPKLGKDTISVTHDGVVLYFSSQKNKALFLVNPKTYLPQYGGFCAYGVGMESTGYPAGRYKVDPKVYKLIAGKLYLFYPCQEWAAITFWNANETFFKERADKKWEAIKDQ